MISNARMYSVTPAVGQLWRRLFEAMADAAGVSLSWVDHRAPAPIDELWSRADMGAVFMCGLPYARSEPRPEVVCAPVPVGPGFEGRPQYWSELVVRADSRFEKVEDTFGRRIALTVPGSQSGCLAPLHFFASAGGASGVADAPGGLAGASADARRTAAALSQAPLFQEVIAPQITPVGAATAVANGLAEIAPIDSFAFALLERHNPQLTAKLRVVARTSPTAIPPIVASHSVPASLETAFLEAHNNTSMAALMADLRLERFMRPDQDDYDVLRRRFEAAAVFWRQHRFAASVDPAFAGIL
jgi:ABC-type phosphate/phosphonate transport system substrate-binding protein